jgi:cellulose synthase/poly-beta-1,6-N-acetylglucosamine synthase-like glycosyltransferase
MRLEMPKSRILFYLTLCLPFILAYASWRFFPVFANWLSTQVFRYSAVQQPPCPLWLAVTSFFYAWYTFLAIGFAGVWALIATYTRIKQGRLKKPHYPMVSFIVPAYNEERNVSRCINSLYKCVEKYHGSCEIIVVDDGSTDYTYEIAWATVELNRKKHPSTRAKIVRHTANLGKVEAIKTGLSKALGNLIAIVDADSRWTSDTLVRLVDYMLLNGKKAVTGYVHPTDGDEETSPYTILQQLEYSQGLGIVRCAQSLGDKVLVVSGAIGLYDAEILRKIFNEKSLRSVTDDLEITLEMHKRGANVGYVSAAKSITVAPTTLNFLWSQRLRWFTGWLHNTLSIHRDLLLRKSWLTLLLWYCYIFEYGGAFIDLAAITAFPLIFWFAPDRILFLINLLIFLPYGFLIGVVNQAIALKYAYNNHNYRALLFYTPFYPIIRFINITARLTSILHYSFGDRGNWYTKQKRFKP